MHECSEANCGVYMVSSMIKQWLSQPDAIVSEPTYKFPCIGTTRSTIVKLCVLYKYSEDDAEEKELHLVAKMLPDRDTITFPCEAVNFFKSELFFYRKLLSVFRTIEESVALPRDMGFDSLPRFYSARVSAGSPDGEDERLTRPNDRFFDQWDTPYTGHDKHAAILMQDLECDGYYSVDKMKGLDRSHAKLAVKALARFHALGCAVERHSLNFFESLRYYTSNYDDAKVFHDEDDLMNTINLLYNYDEIRKHREFVDKVMAKQTFACSFCMPNMGPWCSIIHADFRVDKLMFRRNSLTDEVDDIKILDFQQFTYGSPLRELVCFLLTSLEDDVLKNSWNELVEIYRRSFVQWSERLGHKEREPNIYTKNDFYKKLKLCAFLEFGRSLVKTKLMLASVEEKKKSKLISKIVLDESALAWYVAKVEKWIVHYVHKGYFDVDLANIASF